MILCLCMTQINNYTMVTVLLVCSAQILKIILTLKQPFSEIIKFLTDLENKTKCEPKNFCASPSLYILTTNALAINQKTISKKKLTNVSFILLGHWFQIRV